MAQKLFHVTRRTVLGLIGDRPSGLQIKTRAFGDALT